VTAVSSAVAIAAYDGSSNVASTIAAGGTPDPSSPDLAADMFAAAGTQISVFSSRYATHAGPGEVHPSDAHIINTPREMIFPDLPHTLSPPAGSPTINAGLDDSGPMELDLAGNRRKMGPAPDMGAYEWVTRAPTVRTGELKAVSSSSALVGGSVDAGGDTTTARVEYGTTPAYGAAVDGGSIGAGTLPVDVSAAITGLAPRTTYHYRVVAKNGVGTTPGADATFTTAAAPAATPGPTPTPQPSVKPKVTIWLGSNKHCLRTRSQSIRVRIASGGKITSVEVRVNKRRRLRVTRPALLKKSIKVTKLPAGAYTLEVRVKTKDGRTVKSSKKYRTCSAR
jgi:hypothetical protein